MLSNLAGLIFGLIVTIALGCFCRAFLNRSVTVTIPAPYEFLAHVRGAGGRALGFLERCVFFSSLWLDSYSVGPAWLLFKVAAKWAAWQHVIKIPDVIIADDVRENLDLKNRLGSLLLGRFLNGTLYNLFCAVVGWIFGKLALWTYHYYGWLLGR